MKPPITGVVLAGGMGRRMGSLDKGLQLLRGKPLLQRVIERFAPQVEEILISANRNLEAYRRFGYPVIGDALPGYAGPLAGLHSALLAARREWVASVPCDSPLLPLDLVERLYAALEENHAELAVAKTGAQLQPVFCLCHKRVLPKLEAYLASGQRKMDAWFPSLASVEVSFDAAAAFSNVNTPQQLAALEQTFGNC